MGDIVLVSQGNTASTETAEDILNSELSYHAEVKVLTEKDLDQYTIDDVLIPIPGPAITMPENIAADAMLEAMERDGFPFQDWEAASKNYPIKGGYRKVLCRPENLSHKIILYDDETIPLIATDADILDGKKVAENKADGKHKALCMTFDLPSGSYATMFFRELLKRGSGRKYQAVINEKWANEKNNE